jgi:hydrogenase maturation protein HypF
MLPYSPLHHLLFVPVPGSAVPPPGAVVLTSGNLADERICFDDDDARSRLAGLADAVCTHDRPIVAPCDDSVVRVADGHVVPIRRSRGFAPLPVRLPVAVAPTVALGGELKATLCVATGHHAWMSQHIGDLGGLDTERALEDIRAGFCRIYGVDPVVHAVDRHPGYRSHRLSLERGWPGRVEVQHHHAHVASVMAEHGLDGSSSVIGIAFDGTGYGTAADGTPEIWGGEVLLADYTGFERVGHLAALPLPGGDAAVRNPCRVAVAYLAALGIVTAGTSPAEAACDDTERAVVARMVERGTGCVPTTSMGRLFDVAASLLGIRHRVTYEAQAAIELEAAASGGRPVRPLAFDLGDDGVLDPRPVLEGLLAGRNDGVAVTDLACSFHQAVAGAVVASAQRASVAAGLLPVALSGGVFQNALLTGLARRSLEEAGFTVLTHRSVPPNDGGLALGQAVIAGSRRS